jgi:hypothetical protein
LETTPYLLPDFHPWWQPSHGSAANPIWQYCWGPQFFVYNPVLYWDPAQPVISPPGARDGFVGQLRWIDTAFSAAAGFTSFEFERVSGTCAWSGPWEIGGNYDNWGFGIDSFNQVMPFAQRFLPLDPTRFSIGSSCMTPKRLSTHAQNAAPIGLRYTVERYPGPNWGGTIANNNIQTFTVTIEEGAEEGQ